MLSGVSTTYIENGVSTTYVLLLLLYYQFAWIVISIWTVLIKLVLVPKKDAIELY